MDVDWQRRKRIADQVGAVFQRQETPASTPARLGRFYPTAMGDLGDLVGDFFKELNSLALGNTDDAQELVASCTSILVLRDQVRAAPDLRPWKLTRHAVLGVTEQLVHVMRRYLAAFSARTPRDGQATARTANEALDSLGVEMDELSTLMGWWNEVTETDDLSQILNRMAIDAFSATSAHGLVDIDASLRRRYQDVTDREPPVGTGPAYELQRMWVKALGDEARFNKALAAADALLSKHAQTFETMLSREVVLSELRNGWLHLADQLVASHGAIAAALNDRQVVRTVLASIHTLFEGPGRRFVLVFLELVGKGAFERGLTQDGADRIQLAYQDRRLRQAFYGLDKGLRVAYAHQSFEVLDGFVVARTRGGEVRISEDELLDHLLAAQECLGAVGLALTVAAQRLSVDIAGPHYLGALGLTPYDMAAMMLGFGGGRDVKIDSNGGHLHVRFATSEFTVSHLSVLATALEGDESVRVSVSTGDGRAPDEWEVDLGAVRSQHGLEGIAKEIGFIHALTRMMRNGERALPDEAVKHWAASRALMSIQLDYPDAARELRALEGFAVQHEYANLQASIRQAKRFTRLRATAASDQAGLNDVIALTDFLLDPPPSLPFDSLTG